MKGIMPISMEKIKRDVDSDFYFNHPDKIKDMEEYSEITPVDVNGAFVPTEKEGNLAKTQANIRRRFLLGGED